jgi:alkylhydroperoxidase/carboxymuconolactone decarboxylase family protein YurZ
MSAGLPPTQASLAIEPVEVRQWFVDRVAAEAIRSSAHAWDDDELSLRDRSLIVIAALIAQGDR